VSNPLDPPNPPPDGQTDLEPIVSIEGVVERIVYENADNGFVVARLAAGNGIPQRTFVGEMLAVTPGETVRLHGRWVEDKRFGKQLRVQSFQTLLPTSVEGIQRYLGSGLVEGIGPAYAERLVNAFGLETLRIIEEQPERLRAVSGIGPKRARQIRAAWDRHRAIQSVMIFLQGQGITTAEAVRIYKAYGDKAMAVIRANPYQLAQDISGVSFMGADRIAQKLGVALDAPQRLDAGLEHALRSAEQEGHVFLQESDLLDRAAELLSISREQLQAPLIDLITRQGLIREGQAIYRPLLYSAERGVADLLRTLLRTPHDPVPIQIEKALAWVEDHFKIALAAQQREAIRLGVSAKVMVITGGPGTGKTTVIRSLLAILEKKGLSYLLAAPTGRAAKRMQDATDQEAKTIHRLLEFSPMNGQFLRNENNPLQTDMVIVDEASMIDELLMFSLLKAIPPFARLILVGDVDQLPSVGAGNVLLDVIASGAVPVVRLETVFRQAEKSGIIANAHRINQGEQPLFNDVDFIFLERSTPEKTVETIVELIAHRMPSGFGYDPVKDIQILSPMRRGAAGANNLNEVLQEALNPNGLAAGKRGLRQGDKVMQLRNNYELEVYNGDLGVVSLVENEAKELEVTYEDRVVLYNYDDLDNLGLAYAITVHKSQGSEYPAVVIPFLSQHYMMLQRNVLYTAITRGRERVILVGARKAVAMAVRNCKITTRNTFLTQRLRNEVPGR